MINKTLLTETLSIIILLMILLLAIKLPTMIIVNSYRKYLRNTYFNGNETKLRESTRYKRVYLLELVVLTLLTILIPTLFTLLMLYVSHA